MARAQRFESRQSMPPRKSEVQEHKVEIGLLFDQIERGATIARLQDDDISVELGEHASQGGSYERVIVDDKYLQGARDLLELVSCRLGLFCQSRPGKILTQALQPHLAFLELQYFLFLRRGQREHFGKPVTDPRCIAE